MCWLANVLFLNSWLRFSSEGKQGEGWPGWEGAERKLAVLTVAFRYLDTYRDLLQEEGDRSNTFPKVLHTCVKNLKGMLISVFSNTRKSVSDHKLQLFVFTLPFHYY